ncbi:hypothetical protein [Leisingera sp. M523]|uniref:hypothetical protein n=1 Tax=Leisingera sp. M523 TaxID=2867013 RepID=UPI0022072142|nr:hypothetical protein [Leisingera sp. M523]UWQ27840.1 hypothetical protein K3557_13745 [Leisingera sp. M523]
MIASTSFWWSRLARASACSFSLRFPAAAAFSRLIQVLLGHAKLETTTIYTKVATKTIQDVTSPLDLLVSRKAGSG